MKIKTPFPDECDEILTELKKGIVRKGDLAEMFKDKHGDFNLDTLAKHGFITRTYVNEGGHDMIYYQFSGKTDTFKQGQKDYPKKKGGIFI